ncbi:hypothetical protein AOLI_G00177990 [Acnodon oligacanthus]
MLRRRKGHTKRRKGWQEKERRDMEEKLLWDSMEASPNGGVKTVIVPSELTVGPKNLSRESVLFVKMIMRMAVRAAFQSRSAVLAAALY